MGTKQLLLLSQVKSIPKIPRLAEIDVRLFWADLKQDETFSKYFPRVYQNINRVPDRTYFFTVT